jgi:hypothetical protein
MPNWHLEPLFSATLFILIVLAKTFSMACVGGNYLTRLGGAYSTQYNQSQVFCGIFYVLVVEC